MPTVLDKHTSVERLTVSRAADDTLTLTVTPYLWTTGALRFQTGEYDPAEVEDFLSAIALVTRGTDGTAGSAVV
jgi:hypothetical protein